MLDEFENKFDETVNILRPLLESDLSGLNAWRYARQISPGIQELMEALIFEHYLRQRQLPDASFAGKIMESSGKINYYKLKLRLAQVGSLYLAAKRAVERTKAKRP